MKQLNIFVDESGDFGDYSAHSPYYIVVMVLHDQSTDLSKETEKLNTELRNSGYKDHVIHTEPLIRREEDYHDLLPDERRNIFSKLYQFTIKCDIQYKSFIFHKKELKNTAKLEGRMAREISLFIRQNLSYFQGFDRIILYYDNGQHELTRILNTIFSAELFHYRVKKAFPRDHRLFQAADLICTLELLQLKSESGQFSRSEELIFHSVRELKKDFLKGLHKKMFKGYPFAP